MILLNLVEFDSQFEIDVSNLMKEREIYIDFQKIEPQLNMVKNDKYLQRAMRNKLQSSSESPRSFWGEYITGNITWDSNNKCLSCPDKSCLLYINNKILLSL